ncbi:hypothetical protein NSA50_12210 [Clostridium sp. DSM 100503]|uniref:hypothetical protein n=1 Tax=Clostridium sp. DSM 100503 TaxID=2963282 RepID=UPI002149B06A|nr:hypothetical protein [Clostridium sp. DSM 100503]MCR1951807.1 hypothetical protein [Clostridium sp. DSM 100503]
MKNILNILKYNFGKYNSGISKILYMSVFIILCMLTLGIFIKVPFIGELMSVMSIAFISTFLAINFITSIIKFISQISKDNGKLIFTLPIKAWEFMIAKYIEFIILQGSIALVAYIVSSLSGNAMAEVVKMAVFGVAFGTTAAYIVITSFIVIFSSYIYNVGLCILAVIVGGGIIQSFVSGINRFITNLFPYVYLKLGSFIEIDLISMLLGILWVGILVTIAINHLDKKLDII